MAISPMSFQILTPEQANPFGYGMSQGISTYLQQLEARKRNAELPYAGKMQEQAYQKALYENMLQKPRAEGAVPLFKAELEQAQAQAPYTRSQTSHNNALTNELAEKMRLGYLQNEMAYKSSQTGLTNEQRKKYEYERTHGMYDTPLNQLMNNLKQLQLQQQIAQGSQPSNPGQNIPGGQPSNNPMDQQAHYQQAISQQLGGAHPGMAPSTQQQPPMAPGAQPQQMPQPGQFQGNIPYTNIPMQAGIDAMVANQLHMGTPTDPNMLRLKEKQLELAERRERGAAYRATPMIARSADIAVVAPMVGGYSAASRALMDGKTPQEIAKDKGYDPNDRATWPTPAPPPQTPVVTQQQKANIARNAREAIHGRISEALGYYPEKVMGYSPQMISDLLQGKNEEQAGKTLAAVFMNNEENALFSRGMGVQAGLGMLKLMSDKSLNDLGVPGFLQSKKLLDSFRKEVRNYNNIMVGNENGTLNQMYLMQNPVKAGIREELENQNNSSTPQTDEDIYGLND